MAHGSWLGHRRWPRDRPPLAGHRPAAGRVGLSPFLWASLLEGAAERLVGHGGHWWGLRHCSHRCDALLRRRGARHCDPALAMDAGNRCQPRAPVGPVGGGHDPGGDRCGRTHPRLCHRVHAWRRAVFPLLHLSQPVRGIDAHPGPRRELRDVVPGVGAGWPLLLPAHRFLVHQTARRCRGQEGLRGQSDRGPRLRCRSDADLHHLRHTVLLRDLRAGPGPS